MHSINQNIRAFQAVLFCTEILYNNILFSVVKVVANILCLTLEAALVYCASL